MRGQDSNQTKAEAQRLINKARSGCFDGASEQFLLSLRNELQIWLEDIEAEICLGVEKK